MTFQMTGLEILKAYFKKVKLFTMKKIEVKELQSKAQLIRLKAI